MDFAHALTFRHLESASERELSAVALSSKSSDFTAASKESHAGV